MLQVTELNLANYTKDQLEAKVRELWEAYVEMQRAFARFVCNAADEGRLADLHNEWPMLGRMLHSDWSDRDLDGRPDTQNTDGYRIR